MGSILLQTWTYYPRFHLLPWTHYQEPLLGLRKLSKPVQDCGWRVGLRVEMVGAEDGVKRQRLRPDLERRQW